jgi:hypothetical protein
MGVLADLPTGNVALGSESPIVSYILQPGPIIATHTPNSSTDRHDIEQYSNPMLGVEGVASDTVGTFLLPKRKRAEQGKNGSKRVKANYHAHGFDALSALTGRILSRNEAAKKRRATLQRRCG